MDNTKKIRIFKSQPKKIIQSRHKANPKELKSTK